MTDVELNSREYSLILKWYNMVYSANQKEPQKDEVRLFHKLEVLQEASKLAEDFVSDITK